MRASRPRASSTATAWRTWRTGSSISRSDIDSGFLNEGFNEFFGLDQAYDQVGPGLRCDTRADGRHRAQQLPKTVDGFVKYKLLRQCDRGCNMPITLAGVAAMSMNTQEEDLPWYDPHGGELLQPSAGLQISSSSPAVSSVESFTLQLMPGLVHKNLVPDSTYAHDILNMGVAGRIKLTKRVAINAEYFYVPWTCWRMATTNSFSIGFDIETGGHVFQLHATNSTGMFGRAHHRDGGTVERGRHPLRVQHLAGVHPA